MSATLTREQWGAQPPRETPTVLPWRDIDTIFVHYTSMLSDQEGDPRVRMLGVQNFHRNTLKWNDVGYSKAFARDGTKLDGRGWEVYPAATFGENFHSQAIVFLGGDKEGRDDVTDKGRRALGELIREAETLSGRKIAVTLFIRGHRQAVKTQCPGDELMAFIQLRGWEAEEKANWPTPLPKWAWRWMAWRLGEGMFKPHGPANPKVRHLTKAPKLIAPWTWRRLKALLAARKEV